ncbi:MAG: hypothetical protein ACRD22_20605 [Terriglobia bacterium]
MTTWHKLKNGTWGIRADGVLTPRQQITVTAKSGRTETVTVERVLWHGNGISLCAVVAKPRANRHQNYHRRCASCGHTEDECSEMDCVCGDCGGMMR